MKLNFIRVSVLIGFFLSVSLFVAQPAYAKNNYGHGSRITDTLQVGVITSLGNRTLTMETRYEKKAQKYKMVLHPDGYVMTANRGVFKKFSQLKKGDLIAAYGWYRNGQWTARRIDLLDKNDYLIKRLASDAKAGVYYKHERE